MPDRRSRRLQFSTAVMSAKYIHVRQVTLLTLFPARVGGIVRSSRQGQEAVFRSEEVKKARINWLHFVSRSTERPD